jgi:hypothetical protein
VRCRDRTVPVPTRLRRVARLTNLKSSICDLQCLPPFRVPHSFLLLPSYFILSPAPRPAPLHPSAFILHPFPPPLCFRYSLPGNNCASSVHLPLVAAPSFVPPIPTPASTPGLRDNHTMKGLG